MSDDPQARDERVSRAYRDLGDAQPPAALDAAVLAASREALRRPAPRSWASRWAVPVSIAAVLVISVTVALQVEDQRPELIAPTQEVARAPVPRAAEPPAVPKLEARAERQSQAAKPRADASVHAPAADAAPPVPASPSPTQPAEKTSAAESNVAVVPPSPPPVQEPAQAQARAYRQSRDAAGAVSSAPAALPAPAARPAPQALAKLQALETSTPEKELERIAELRKQGRHEDADKALAEFRKRFPDYRIPDDVLKKVERP